MCINIPQNAVEDVWDLAEILITIVTFKAGLTALWSTATNKNTKIGAAVIIIIFLISLVIGMLILLPADATQNLPWTPFYDACSPHPCGSHGHCMDLPGKQPSRELEYKCLCENGWAGPTCQIALACASSPCQAGGGVCEDESDGSFVCVCSQGYTGELCDQVGMGEPCESLQLPNGQSDGQCVGSGTAGGSCFLTCQTPYLLFSEGVLMSSVTRNCQPDGTWTGTMPVCERPDCGGTATVTYSIQGTSLTQLVSCSDDTMYGGDACTVSCDAGFYLSSGSAVLTCGTDGNWAGEPQCSQNCGVLTLDDGSASGQCDGNVGDSCSLSCNANFLLHSATGTLLGVSFATRICSSDGTWTGEMPQCVRPDCGSSAMVAHSTSSDDSIRLVTCDGDTMYGGNDCVVSCEEGFFISSGPSELTCGEDGNWAGEPRCSQNCGSLAVEHGSQSGQCDGNAGDSCTMLGCDAGYLPSDSNLVNTARECQVDGTWSGSALLCIGIPCWVNTVIANSDRTSDNPCVTGTGSTCSFACDAGFHTQGTHTCAADGTLTGGSCERNACTHGLTLPNSPTTCAGVYQEHCLYTCAPGMSATGDHVCGLDRSFAGGACESCSGELQDLLSWVSTDSAMFSYCPTEDVPEDQGVLMLRVGKQLLVDGSRGSGGNVNFNGAVAQIPYFRRTAGGVVATNVAMRETRAWATGNGDDFGSLGLDGQLESLEPQMLSLPTRVVQVSAGESHTMFLDDDGRVRVAS